ARAAATSKTPTSMSCDLMIVEGPGRPSAQLEFRSGGPTAVQTLFTNNFGNSTKGKVARARSSDAWIAVNPSNGEVFVAYVSRDTTGFSQVYAARSTDRGASWTSTRVTDGTRHAGYPNIAVTEDGVVGGALHRLRRLRTSDALQPPLRSLSRPRCHLDRRGPADDGSRPLGQCGKRIPLGRL